MQVGDIVTHKSYNENIKFIVDDIIDKKVELSGLDYRLSLDATIQDLALCNDEDERPLIQNALPSNERLCLVSTNYSNSLNRESSEDSCFTKILHIDSNNRYLKQCMTVYKKSTIPTIGFCIKEEKQPDTILDLLLQYNPNIVVITGHDYIPREYEDSQNLDEFLNSRYFAEAVRAARRYKSNYDELVIIAGGCKSYYEELIKAGANFASSPDRILIHITEPATIACQIASTPIHQFVTMDSIAEVLPSLSLSFYVFLFHVVHASFHQDSF